MNITMNLARRVAVTIGMVILVRLAYFLPVPGVRIEALAELYQQHIQPQGGALRDLMLLFHVGKLRNISVFALGIMPFMNACIMLQIIAFLVPGMYKRFFNLANDRRHIVTATVMLSVVLSCMYAVGAAKEITLFDAVSPVKFAVVHGPLFTAGIICSMSAATLILFAFSRLIARYGIGNGIGVLFASEIIVRSVFAVDQLAVFFARGTITAGQLSGFIAVAAVFIALTAWATHWAIRLSCRTAEQQDFFISIRPYWTGVWPLLFAESVLATSELPLTVVAAGMVLLVIAFFSLLYVKLVYRPRRFYELILSHQCRMCAADKKHIEDCLNHAVMRCVSVSMVIFAGCYFLPVLMPLTFKVSFMSAGILGAFGVPVIVGLWQDISRQMVFYRAVNAAPEQQWTLLDIADDESEAEIVSAYLRGKGIPGHILPSHLSWGMPIHTAASDYRLFVPQTMREKAQVLVQNLRAQWHESAR